MVGEVGIDSKERLPRFPSFCKTKMVGEVGIEPTWYCYHQILSLARLPIPPFAHGRCYKHNFNTFLYFML